MTAIKERCLLEESPTVFVEDPHNFFVLPEYRPMLWDLVATHRTRIHFVLTKDQVVLGADLVLAFLEGFGTRHQHRTGLVTDDLSLLEAGRRLRIYFVERSWPDSHYILNAMHPQFAAVYKIDFDAQVAVLQHQRHGASRFAQSYLKNLHGNHPEPDRIVNLGLGGMYDLRLVQQFGSALAEKLDRGEFKDGIDQILAWLTGHIEQPLLGQAGSFRLDAISGRSNPWDTN
jgi:hypothetical protein